MAATRVLHEGVFRNTALRIVADIDAVAEDSVVSARRERRWRGAANAAGESNVETAGSAARLGAIADIGVDTAITIHVAGGSSHAALGSRAWNGKTSYREQGQTKDEGKIQDFQN